MRLKFQVSNAASRMLRQIASSDVPEARRRMVEDGIKAALESTIQLNPVRTGRSRAAWSAALSRISGQTTGGATSGPLAEGSALGSATIEQGESSTVASATNAVRYVPFLEYGTSKRAPVAMVRRSLAAVGRLVPRWFRLH
jgi:hypothetical protein